MPRGLDPTLLTYLQNRKIRTAFLIEADFESGWVRLTTHSRDIVFQGNTYFQAGTLSIDGISQNLKLQNTESNVSLSGIPSTYKALVLNENYVGNDFNIYQAFFDFTTDEPVIDPILISTGVINGMQFTDDAESGTATINLPISTIWARFEEVKGLLTNPSSHKKLYPNDKIFDMVPSLAEKVIEFGKL